MEENNMELYKDKKSLNRRNETAYKKYLKEIASFIKEYRSNERYLKNVLLKGIEAAREHKANHLMCDRKLSDSDRITEKRICRCMFYYNKDADKCRGCKQVQKWRNIGTLSIDDYEYPTDHVIPRVGGMDLILGNKYACEVKPQNSNETLTRMFAEILTYTQDCKEKYKPAICFFPGSKQMKDYIKYKDNDDFKYISTFIEIFFFNIVNKKGNVIEFEIKPIKMFKEFI